MSPEAQRIAIAEACGWKLVAWSKPLQRMAGVDPGSPQFGCLGDVPDYLNDLNAMHEAENTIRDDLGLIVQYYWDLRAVTYETNKQTDAIPRVMCATAGERAEAFLRTLGKWDNTK